MTSLEMRQKQFEQDLKLLEAGLNQDQSEDYGIIDVDSENIVKANAIPNSLNESEKVTIGRHWWGFNIKCNEKLTQDIIEGTVASGTLGTAIAAAFGAAGIVTGGVATAIGAAFAAAFVLKVAEIKIINNGKGVHFPVTWLQLAPVLLAVPTGPSGIVVAIMVFIHPVRN